MPYPGTCLEGTCIARCISHQVYILCPSFRAFRGKSVLEKKGAVDSKWGFQPFTWCLFLHPILLLESTVWHGGDGQYPCKVHRSPRVMLLLDRGRLGGKLNKF